MSLFIKAELQRITREKSMQHDIKHCKRNVLFNFLSFIREILKFNKEHQIKLKYSATFKKNSQWIFIIIYDYNIFSLIIIKTKIKI